MRPRPWPAVLLVLAFVVAATFVFLSTKVGQRALLDQQFTMLQSFGVKPNEEMLANMERSIGRAPYFSAAGQIVALPVVMAITAAFFLGIFNALLGGDASFKQVFAVVAYSGFVTVLGVLFSMPLQYVRETMSSVASVAVFFPMLDDATFLGRLLGSIDLFRVWWIVNLSIGLGVLYKKRTSPIAWSLLAFGAVLVVAFAAIRTVLSGA